MIDFLVNHPQVEHVNHPSLPEHPDHALYEKYFPNGGASIFTFEIKGGEKEAHKFIDNLKLFSLLANVADVKSLVIHPATTTHSQLSPEELLDQDIKPEHEMEKVLYAVDELTGLIGAVALMRPSKSVSDLEVKSVKKKYKNANFAAGCSRPVIERGAEMLGWEVDELIGRTILAMRATDAVD